MYDNIENFPYVSIFSNTFSDIEDCNDEEEKWNMAFWGCNDEKYLIADDKSAKLLVDWYAENGVDNIGYEDDQQDYDDEMNYIGNGPNGCKELYALISEVVLNLRSDNEVGKIIADIPYVTGDEVAVLVNGLGATPLDEQYIVTRKIDEILHAKGIRVHRYYIGEYATSIEMAGLSISLLKLDEELRIYLDAPAETPFFKQ